MTGSLKEVLLLLIGAFACVQACTHGKLRAKAGTHCVRFEECLNGHWYHDLTMKCAPNSRFSNDIPGCVSTIGVHINYTTCSLKSKNPCTNGKMRAKAGSGCKKFELCSSGHWFYVANMVCPPGTLWSNHIPACVSTLVYDIDSSTCNLRTSTVHHPAASHHKHTTKTTTKSTTTTQKPQPTTTPTTTSTSKPTTTSTTAPTTSFSQTGTTSFQPQLCANKPCYFGVCDPINNGSCRCHYKYFGENCHETRVPNTNSRCDDTPCFNGECIYDYKIQTYQCLCIPGYSGEHCENTYTAAPTTQTTTEKTTTQPITSTQPITTTTTKTTSTTTTVSTTASTPSLPIHFNTCKKFTTVLDIGNHVAVNNTHIQGCPSGTFATPEAFVLGLCNVTLPSTWQQGANVMQSCQHIPLYTPVATFTGSHYSTSGSLSGIFLGCLTDGFKLGVQRCDNTPVIDHIVDGGVFTMDPHLYFTV